MPHQDQDHDLRTAVNPPRVVLTTVPPLLSTVRAITYIHASGHRQLARLERAPNGDTILTGWLPQADEVVICEITFLNGRAPQRSHAVRVPRAEIEAAEAAQTTITRRPRRTEAAR